MSLRARFPVDTSGGLRVCVLRQQAVRLRARQPGRAGSTLGL